MRPAQSNLPASTFSDAFLVLPENRFAHSATDLLLQRGLKGRGALLHIDGPSGSGKSHLVQNFIRRFRTNHHRLDKKQLQVMDFVRNREQFRERRSRVQNCRLLLCEDAHTLDGQTSIQWSLSDLFDELLASGCRIVVTSKFAPTKLPGIQRRLVNRLQAGICASIQAPNLTSRIKLLEHFAATRQLALPKTAFRLIAEQMSVSPRELIATLQQIETTANLLQRPTDLTLVRDLLKKIVKPPLYSIAEITRTVAREFRLPVAELRKQSRSQDLVRARHCAMFLCRTLTNEPYSRIAQHFGIRSHSSVVYGCQRIKRSLPLRPQLRQRLTRIADRLAAET